MKLLSIDYGRKRIGIAATSELGFVIRSVGTLSHNGTLHDALEKTEACIRAENPDELVFGVPLDGYDNETEMSLEVRTFAAHLKEKIDLPQFFVDESFSSVFAHQILSERPKKKRRKKAAVDKIAACLILESFLRERM